MMNLRSATAVVAFLFLAAVPSDAFTSTTGTTSPRGAALSAKKSILTQENTAGLSVLLSPGRGLTRKNIGGKIVEKKVVEKKGKAVVAKGKAVVEEKADEKKFKFPWSK